MTRHAAWTLALVLGAVLAARAAQAPSGAAGIAWFEGDVGAAFNAAQAAKKPVFLYWGAKWCPPCQQLKSSVFSRSDFIAKSRQFVSVYLDGDNPGAQKWGEKFHVVGYPTVVILRPDQREITRIAGGMDLSSYADLLDAALNDVRPMGDLIAAMRGGGVNASTDCRRLAYYGWELGDYSDAEREALAAGLTRAVGPCGGAHSAEGARLAVAAAALRVTPQSISRVIAIVENRALAERMADALERLGPPVFKAVRARGPAAGAAFVNAWTAIMDSVSTDPRVIDADQLAALAARLEVTKEFAADKKVPADVAAAARSRVTAALAKKLDPYVRTGVVNAAAAVYEQIGDVDGQYAMLKGELTTSHTPYYYMIDLGEIEEDRHHPAEALLWYERAYRESEGIATRFQWGVAYLSALLRLAPAEHERIRDTALMVIGELDGPDRIHARTRMGLEKLDQRLRKWNARHQYDADIEALRARMSTACGKLPPDDAGRSSCRNFLG